MNSQSKNEGNEISESNEESNTNMAIEQLLALRQSPREGSSPTNNVVPQSQAPAQAQPDDLLTRHLQSSNAQESLAFLQHGLGGGLALPNSGPLLERFLLAQHLQQSTYPVVPSIQQLQLQQQFHLDRLLQERAALALQSNTPLAAQIQPLASIRNPGPASPIPKTAAFTVAGDAKTVKLVHSLPETSLAPSSATTKPPESQKETPKLPLKKRKAPPPNASPSPAIVAASSAAAGAIAQPSKSLEPQAPAKRVQSDSFKPTPNKKRRSPSKSPQLKPRSQEVAAAPDASGIIYETTDQDVLSVRSRGKGYDPPGNKAFREIVRKYHDFYLKATSKTEKNTVITFILEQVKATGARFLRRNDAEDDMANGVSWVSLLPQEEHQKVRDLLIRMCSGKR